jgi:Ca2+-binding EF-hand superfamily protein
MYDLQQRMNKTRRDLVDLAFDVIDRDGSGELDVADMIMMYDVTHHPEFTAGKKSKDQILRELLDVFDVGGEKDGKVTREEFRNYYQQISAAIDSDAYFELMIRNAWHISGGEGAAANSANRRVLVTRPDGRQEVVEIKSDLGLAGRDKQGAIGRLKAQGVDANDIDFNGGVDEDLNDRYRSGRSAPPMIGRPRPVSASQAGAPRSRQEIPRRGSNDEVALSVLINDVREQLTSDDAKGLIDIQRLFQDFDEDASGQLNLAEFTECIRNCRVFRNCRVLVSPGQVQRLFLYFGKVIETGCVFIRNNLLYPITDRDRSGEISYDEFIDCIRV